MNQHRKQQMKHQESASNLNLLLPLVLLALFLFLFIRSVKSQDKIIGFNAYGSVDNGGNSYQINTDGSNYAVNAIFPYSISGNPTDMVDGNDGYIYANGPGNGYTTGGVIFKVKYDGSNYTILKKFTLSTDGSSPRFRPVLGTDGFVYGLNESGGANNTGTIWRVKRDGSLFSVIYNFPASTGAYQNYLGSYVNVDYTGFFGSLTFGLDGKLYGLCGGGSLGTHLFRLNTNGSGFTILLHGTGYNNSPIPGAGIASPLTLGSDGNFYGCFTGGGLIDFAGGKGVVFKFNPVSSAYTVLHYFPINGFEGKTPYGLAEGPSGFLYGVCYNLGIPNGIETDHGTIWKIAKDGTGFNVLKQLSADTTGNGTNYKIVAGLNNKIYFSTHSNGHPLVGSGAGGCFMSINPDGTGFTVLRNDFEGNSAPHSFFFRQDATGAKFFGVSGISTDPLIYTMDTLGGRYTPIHKLSYSSYGYAPNCKPVVVTNPTSSQNGFVFGVAVNQGVNNCGTMFKYVPALTTLKAPEMVSYMRNVTSNYRGSIIGNYTPLLASDGKLYGTYSLVMPFVYNVGNDAIYQLPTATNSEPITIKRFANLGPTACSGFSSSLMEGDDGYIYGTTSSSFSNVYGTIFKMQKDGSNYANIYFFPTSRGLNSLLQDPVTHKIICSGSAGIFSINTDGTAYTPISLAYAVNPGIVLQGDTLFGIYGSGSNWGVYKVHKSATGFISLRTFTGSADGYYPNGEITIGTDGFIYGTCGYGGTYGYGTLFKMDKNGNNFAVLRHFTGTPDGGQPGPVSFMPCTAPNNATNILFTGSTGNAITLSGFTAPETGAIGYVIKMNTTNAFSDMVDGINPTASLVYGGSEQVIYNGTTIPTALTVTGLTANTTYYFKVYAYGCNARFYNNLNTTGNPAQYRTQPIGLERVTGRMLHCNGINQYANAGDVNAVEGLSALSFGGWMKPFAFPNTTLSQQSIICKGDGVNAATTSFFIKMYKDEVDLNVKLSAAISISGAMTPLNINIDSSLFKINQWSHVFVTWQSGERMRVYINGKLVGQSLSTISGAVNNIAGDLRFGSSTATSEQTFNGDMEEVSFYQTQLNLCEIRQRMHNTLSGAENGLISYYQFNDATSSSNFMDVIGLHNAARVNAIANPVSNLAVAGGNSFCDAVYSTGLFQSYSAFDASNVFQLNFPSDVPNGDINVSYLEATPVGGNPSAGNNVINGYWIVNNFGTNTTNLNASVGLRLPDGVITDADITHYTLYKRGSVSFGAWAAFPVTAISLATGNNSITVIGVQDFSQFVLMNTFAVPLPSVTIGVSSSNICFGTSITFTATPTNGGSTPTYNFLVNGLSVQNSASNTYTVSVLNNGDVVSCIISNGVTTATSNSITMVVRDAPTVAAITGVSSNCTIGSITYLSNATSGGVWSSSSPSVAGITSNGRVASVANGATTINYTVTNLGGCSASSSLVYNVAVVATPPAITGVTNVCIGLSTILSNATTGGVWSSIGGRASINSDGVVTGASAGVATIRYTVSNAFGCSTYVATSVLVNALPNVPSIAYAAGTTNPQTAAGGAFCANRTFTVAGTPTGGVWSSTGVITVGTSTGVVNTGSIAGAGSLTYTYTNVNGCSNSRTIAGNVAVCASRGVNNGQLTIDNEQWTIYPNPAKTVISLQVKTLVGAGSIVITDLYGKQVKVQALSLGNNTIDIATFGKGIYMVSIIGNSIRQTKKLIVE